MWLRPYPQYHPHPPRLHTRWYLQPYLQFTYQATFTNIYNHTHTHTPGDVCAQGFISIWSVLQKRGVPCSGEIGFPFESRWDALLFQPGLILFGPLFPIPKYSYPKSLIIIIRATINPVVIHQTEWWIIPLQVWSTPFGSPSSLTQQTLRPELTLTIPKS